MEERLIDAFKLTDYANNTKDKTIDANDIMRFPAVDAVEVVRCKDCKHNYANMIPASHFGTECCLCVELPITDDFYCAKGKRREDDDTNKA